jgi:hypothetical protein
LPDTQWLLALVRCVQSLRFNQLRLVLDVSGNGWPEWVAQFALPNLDRWTAAGLTTHVFVPEDPAQKIGQAGAISSAITCRELRWHQHGTEDLLRDMLLWRYQRIANQFEMFALFQELLPSELMSNMIAWARTNPRCLFRLWNQILSLEPTRWPIDEALVQQAESQITCP